MKTKDKSNKLIKALLALGKTKSSVAKKLQSLGIKGYRKEDSSCPIANYLNKECRLKGDISVDEFDIETWDAYIDLAEHDNLEHISDFILDFDHGKYPKLEKKRKPYFYFNGNKRERHI